MPDSPSQRARRRRTSSSQREAGQSVGEIAAALRVIVVVLAALFLVYRLVWGSDENAPAQVADAPTARATVPSVHPNLADTPGAPPTSPPLASTPIPASPPTMPAATQRQLLAEAVLTTADLAGGGWQRTVVDGSQISDTYYCNPNDRFAGPQTGAVFTDSSGRHLLVTEGVSLLPNGGAADLLRRLRAATADCNTLHTSDGGRQITLTIAPRSFAAFGDDTFALSIATRVQGQTHNSEGLLLIIQRGELVAALLDLAPGPLDVSDAQSIARSADAKLLRLQTQLH